VTIDDTSVPASRAKGVAQMNAERELSSGNYRVAVVHYENAGMLPQAIEIAEKNADYALMGRLHFKMGNKASARNNFARGGDPKSAGNISLLMGEPKKAREYYAKAAERLQARDGPPGEVAGLLDRAKKRAEAGPLYEEAAEFERSAEAYKLAGDGKAFRIKERAETIKAYEQRKSGDRVSTDRANMAIKNARAAETAGDYFEAAWMYRAIEEWKAAARCYERMEEWERCALCHERDGNPAKAAEIEDRIPPAERVVMQPRRREADRDGSKSGTGNLPNPSSAPQVVFVPLSQNPEMAAQMLSQMDLSRIAGRQMSGNAGPKAWEDIADQLEARGSYSQAAELNLKMGRVEAAARCLSKAAKPLEAALMAIGIGDYINAAEHLVKGLEQQNDPDVGLLLGEMLIRLKDPTMAYRLFRTRLMPTVSQENAAFVYKYARLFEDGGYMDKATRLYRALVDSGARCAELDSRLRTLRVELTLPDSEDDLPPDSLGEDGITAVTAPTGEFTGRSSSSDRIPLVVMASGEPYEFTPPDHNPLLGSVRSMQERNKVGKIGMEVSLIGEAPDHSETGRSQSTEQTVDPFSPSKRYEIVRELGKGGMGVVYEAMDVILNRRLALKLVNSFEARPENLKQFLLEARAIAQMTHPNVIMIFDVGIIELRHYIAMEFIDGMDLKAYIAKNDRLPLKEALRLFIEIAEGLKAVHTAGIVHRDIKPANVLLSKDLHAKIVDFGLAKLEAPPDAPEEETMFKSAGTPGYMSPEQVRGEDLVPACDIYALGITLFTMLVGQSPHMALKVSRKMDIFMMGMEGKLPTIREYRPDVPPAIDHLFRFCTMPSVTERYQNIDAFLPVVRQWHDAS